MDEPSPAEMLDLAIRLAREAVSFSLPHAGRIATQCKTDKSVVTAVDHAIQEHILRAIAAAYPDHAVAAEETLLVPSAHADRRKARFCWVVDPLDGTRNFVAGFPCFATSIAVLDHGEPVVGAIVEHNLGHIWTALRGEGTRFNGRPARVCEPQPGEDILVGIASNKDRLTVEVAGRWIATRGLICRNMGSTAVHLGMVASGAISGAFCKRCKIWDLAAGALLITEAGGVVTDPFGHPRTPFSLEAEPGENVPFLAGTPVIHEKLLQSIQESTPDRP